ncbi:MAG: exodeoxyribonuclease V subunit gamma, partial [Desulfobacula sp.]|nr:exodeoxyribonuclease V subunit gamma [Desulfobacula sp.]
MAAFAAVLAQAPEDPMAGEWVCVQSRGMKQWITAALADTFGISANMQFVFPKQIVAHILSSVPDLVPDDKPDDSAGDQGDESFFFWSVLALLMKIEIDHDTENEFSRLSNYIKDDDTGKKKFQLAKKIAKLFDDYMVYRPDMLLAWQNQARSKSDTFKKNQDSAGSPTVDPEILWQAALWNKIESKFSGQHPAIKTQSFLKNTTLDGLKKNNLPARISFFGISALPPVFLQVIEKISTIIDVHLFLLVPSNLFFFDMKSKRQELLAAISNQAQDEFNFFSNEMTNPLLTSLGTSGQRFLTQIENYDYLEPGPDLFYDPGVQIQAEGQIENKPENQADKRAEKSNILTVLQSDILNLVHRKQGNQDKPLPVLQSDTSICINACHSPMREAQILKDLLLDAFAKDNDLAPHDIIIMMPDIESYAPFIESVFTLEERLPFSISDRKKRSKSESLEAFLTLLSLQGSRLEKSRVLDVMAYESIASKFGFETAGLINIEKMLADVNILWGKDGAHRESLGVPGFKENTWEFGLERLFMGMAMPEHYEYPVNGVLPCNWFEGSDLEVLGKLSRFCYTFFSCLKRLGQPKTIEKWCQTLIHICDTMMHRHQQNNSDMAFLYQQIDAMKSGAHGAGFKEKVPFEMIQSFLIQQLDLKVSQGKFLAGKITFCNIMPMRSIPYKIVVLMGMDEGAFPRQVFGPGFDLMKKYPRLGDKNERLEDRYLFLETLLSVRQKMIITYTGLDIRDNSPIPCSGVVSELMDVMNDSFDFPDGYEYHISHPLHPFNCAYFTNKGPLFSFSKDNFKISKALLQAESIQTDSGKPFFIQPIAHQNQQNHIENKIEPPSDINMDEFVRYFKHPVEWMMKQRLKIVFPHLEQETQDRESFSIVGLDQYTLGSWLVGKQEAIRDLIPEIIIDKEDHYPTLKAMGSLPYGQKGRVEYEKLQLLAEPVMDAVQTISLKKTLLPVVKQLKIDDLTINVHLKDIREDGLTVAGFGKLNSARLLLGWIQHLFLNACAPKGYPKRTRLIGRDPGGKKPVFIVEFEALKDPDLEHLKVLAKLYEKGISRPLCF